MIAVANPNVSLKVINIISKIGKIKPSRLRTNSNLNLELEFDTLDVVNIIWKLEESFKIVIPDEVPLNTVGDFVEIVVGQTRNNR
jgi:acyl carrier protein